RGAGPALTDLLGGQVQVLFAAAPGVIEHVRTNKLRALAVTGAARLQAMPNIPTAGEFIPDFEASLWLGLGAPANTPRDLIETLNGDINAVLMDAKIKTRLSELGGVPMPLTAVQFGKLISDETEKWAKVIRFAGLKPG